ncbi:MAG TPA: nitrogen fixation protein NifQ [Burkholderiaceae bacterium]|nr:nitrogen fixation protein NifQ [Burkholderiaceae bacterium]
MRIPFVPIPLAVARQAARAEEVVDLTTLLMEFADPQAGPPAMARAIARGIAVASLGDNHLWQDMQLRSRAELSALIRQWFPRLAARNDRDMKWKKFFYKQLCEREQIFVCRSPSCAVCSDYDYCFGPEDATS